MGSHVRPTINRSPRTKSRTGGAAFASLNRRPLRRRLLPVPRIRLRSAMLAASPMRHTNSMRSAGPRRLRRAETCLRHRRNGRIKKPVELAAAGLHARGHFKLGDPLCFHRLGELLGDVTFVHRASSCASFRAPPWLARFPACRLSRAAGPTSVCRWDNNPRPASRRLPRPGRLRVRGESVLGGRRSRPSG
jgi:hypothetical protein